MIFRCTNLMFVSTATHESMQMMTVDVDGPPDTDEFILKKTMSALNCVLVRVSFTLLCHCRQAWKRVYAKHSNFDWSDIAAMHTRVCLC